MPRTGAGLELSCAAVLTAALSGCGGSPHAPEEKYYLIATNIKSPYWQVVGAGLVRAARQMQVQAEMVGPDTYDPKGEHEEFQRVIKRKPAGILVSPSDPDLLKSDIDEAIAAGIPVITMDSDSPASKRLLFIGTNNYQAGLAGGRQLVKHLQGKGSVVVLTMPGQANLVERLRGYQDAFEGHPQIKIAEVVDIRGDPRLAFDRTMEIIEKGTPKVDAFVCLVSTAGKEVAEVLDRKRVTDKIVMAMDTHEDTLAWIEKGEIAATIGQKPFTMAYYGLKMLDDLHHHKLSSLTANWAQDSFSPIPTFVDTGTTFVDKTNLAAFRQASGAARPAGN